MFSGSKRLIAIAVFIIVVIVLVNAIWWLYYDRTQTMMDRQLSRRLAAVAQFPDPGPLGAADLQGRSLVQTEVASQFAEEGQGFLLGRPTAHPER